MCFCVVLCVGFCMGHFVMVPSNMTYLHCLQHSFFELLFNLYYIILVTILVTSQLLYLSSQLSSPALSDGLSPTMWLAVHRSWFVVISSSYFSQKFLVDVLVLLAM